MRQFRGFTLLELLLVVALLAALVVMLWSLIQVYLYQYGKGSEKAERSQLVRSLSQLLNDDLNAAIQDPIHPLPPGYSADDSVRRFGLSGTVRSLRIDVVQINPIAASSDTSGQSDSIQRRAASGSVRGKPQVPELKTVYYDFYPLDKRDAGTTEHRTGLTRRELSFESPTGPGANPDAAISDPLLAEGTTPLESTRAVGTPLPTDALGISDTNLRPEFSENGTRPGFPASSSANSLESRLFLAGNDDLMWAPEVVDCRFRYGDGKTWSDSWDSIERNGLPLAIEVRLRLMPIDDAEQIRQAVSRSGITPELPNGFSNGFSEELPTAEQVDSTRTVSSGSLSMELSEEFPATGFESGLETGTQSENGRLQPQHLNGIVKELGLAPPLEQRVIVFLPTSPYRKNAPIRRPAAPKVEKGGDPPAVPESPMLRVPEPPTQPPVISPPKKPKKSSQEWIRGNAAIFPFPLSMRLPSV